VRDDRRAVDGDGWLGDARTVRVLVHVLATEAGDQGSTVPASRGVMVAVLVAARERLRRRLLLAEGLDPRTGRLAA